LAQLFFAMSFGSQFRVPTAWDWTADHHLSGSEFSAGDGDVGHDGSSFPLSLKKHLGHERTTDRYTGPRRLWLD
jgi:hypothetical protein